MTSVFGALGPRTAKDAVLDVGVSWDNAKVHPDTEPVPVDAGLGRLWAWGYNDENGMHVVEYLVGFPFYRTMWRSAISG